MSPKASLDSSTKRMSRVGESPAAGRPRSPPCASCPASPCPGARSAVPEGEPGDQPIDVGGVVLDRDVFGRRRLRPEEAERPGAAGVQRSRASSPRRSARAASSGGARRDPRERVDPVSWPRVVRFLGRAGSSGPGGAPAPNRRVAASAAAAKPPDPAAPDLARCSSSRKIPAVRSTCAPSPAWRRRGGRSGRCGRRAAESRRRPRRRDSGRTSRRPRGAARPTCP